MTGPMDALLILIGIYLGAAGLGMLVVLLILAIYPAAWLAHQVVDRGRYWRKHRRRAKDWLERKWVNWCERQVYHYEVRKATEQGEWELTIDPRRYPLPKERREAER